MRRYVLCLAMVLGGINTAIAAEARVPHNQDAPPGPALTPEQAISIYATHYWEPAKCPALPANLALVHFDAAVNCGVGQAARFLQHAVGVTVDGIVGPLTIAAAWKAPEAIGAYFSVREAFYRRLAQANPAEGVFLQGWLNRLANLKAFLAQAASSSNQ